MNPTLCRVPSYFEPGFPSPTTSLSDPLIRESTLSWWEGVLIGVVIWLFWLSHCLIDLALEFFRSGLESLQGFTEGSTQFWKSFWTENQESNGADHRHFGEADAEDIHQKSISRGRSS